MHHRRLLQPRDVQDDIVPTLLHHVKLAACPDDIWEAWYGALLAAAPLLDRPTADRAILTYAIVKSTAALEGDVRARVRACKLLAAAVLALSANGEVCFGPGPQHSDCLPAIN